MHIWQKHVNNLVVELDYAKKNYRKPEKIKGNASINPIFCHFAHLKMTNELRI